MCFASSIVEEIYACPEYRYNERGGIKTSTHTHARARARNFNDLSSFKQICADVITLALNLFTSFLFFLFLFLPRFQRYSSGGMMDYVDSDSEDEEDVAPKPKISLEQKTREARAKHRKLAAGCPRINGVGIYVGGPVIARDLKHGWFPSKIVSINPEKRTIKVHFNGWHKRFDFSAPFDSDRFKPASVELLASGKSTVMEGM